jgi:hypothetical protein
MRFSSLLLFATFIIVAICHLHHCCYMPLTSLLLYATYIIVAICHLHHCCYMPLTSLLLYATYITVAICHFHNYYVYINKLRGERVHGNTIKSVIISFFYYWWRDVSIKKKKPIVSIYPDYPIFLTLGQDFLRLCHLDL